MLDGIGDIFLPMNKLPDRTNHTDEQHEKILGDEAQFEAAMAELGKAQTAVKNFVGIVRRCLGE